MRSIPNKHTTIATPVRKIRHIEDRINIINFRLFQASRNHRIPPTRVSLAKLSSDSLHVWFLSALGQVCVIEREVDQLLGRRLRETAVAKCACAAVDEDDSGVVEVGLRQRFVEVQDAAYGAVAAVDGY